MAGIMAAAEGEEGAEDSIGGGGKFLGTVDEEEN